MFALRFTRRRQYASLNRLLAENDNFLIQSSVPGLRHASGEPPSKSEEIMKDLHDIIKDRNLAALSDIFSISNHNLKNKKGWTPLMLSARFGDEEIARFILEKGGRADVTNFNGHTPQDIAAFWNNQNVFNLLSQNGKNLWKPRPFFTQSPVRRSAEKRTDSSWVLKAIQNKNTRYLVTFKGLPLVADADERKLKILSLDYNATKDHIADDQSNLIFLGLFDKPISDNESDSIAYFSIDARHTCSTKDNVSESFNGSSILNPYPDFLRLSRQDAALVGHARSLWDWHHRNKFCPTCGSTTKLAESGHKRQCNNDGCLSRKGVSNTSYPRVDPTVITTVISPDRRLCLLGRKPTFPTGMYSCLAGFVEPGESLEDTCHREVEEEIGLQVDSVEYVCSQPWPMPSALMVGYQATVTDTVPLKLDEDELEDVRWFTRGELVQMLNRSHPDHVWIPPRQALANQLIHDWVLRTAFM